MTDDGHYVLLPVQHIVPCSVLFFPVPGADRDRSGPLGSFWAAGAPSAARAALTGYGMPSSNELGPAALLCSSVCPVPLLLSLGRGRAVGLIT